MIINRTGEIVPGLYVLASADAPVFLLDGDRPVLFDAGFTCLARPYLEHAGQILAGREPACCCLTHSHFDHIGAVSRFKERYPGLKVCASSKVDDLMKKPSVVERISMLSRAAATAAADYGLDPADIDRPFEPFSVDRPLREGDEISVSDEVTVQVIETPGHTRDCLSYYIPEKKILIASEALGIPDYTGYVVTDFLVDYDTFLASMRQLESLEIDVLCFGHTYVYTGQDCRDFIPTAIQHARDFFSLVAACLKEEGGDHDRVIQRLRAVEYDGKSEPKQPEPAYLMNLAARVAVVEKRLARMEEQPPADLNRSSR